MSRRAVWTDDPAFLAAVGQLPDRVRVADGPRNAICVVDARDLSRVAETVAGASAVILTHAGSGSRADLGALGDAADRLIAHRPRLRADEVDDARVDATALRLFAVDAVSGAAVFRETTVDAIGWARSLAQRSLRLRAAVESAAGVVAALDTQGTVPVSMTITRLQPEAASAIRVTGVGEVRVDVEVDDAAGVRRIGRTDRGGQAIAAPRLESAARLSLRRALDVIAGSVSHDIEDLLHDIRLADDLVGDPLA